MDKLVAALRLTGIGFFIGISIVGGVVAGLWLDDKFHTSPALVLVGLLAGIIVAGFGLYKMLIPLVTDTRKKKR